MKKADLLNRIHQLEQRVRVLESSRPYYWGQPFYPTTVPYYTLPPNTIFTPYSTSGVGVAAAGIVTKSATNFHLHSGIN